MGLEVSFANRKLEKRCTQHKTMTKAYGAVVAKALMKRMNELVSADTVGDVLQGPGKWHPFGEDQLSAHLTGNWRLLVTPADETSDCTAVEVTDVDDYH